MKKEMVGIFFLNLFCLLLFIFDRLFKKTCLTDNRILTCQKNPNFLFIINHNFLIYLVILILTSLTFLLIRNYQIKKMWSIFSLTLILGGGFSNFFDRLQLDAVIDYLNFFNIFTFNLADAMIFVGVILFFIRLFFIKAPTPEQRDLNKSF